MMSITSIPQRLRHGCALAAVPLLLCGAPSYSQAPEDDVSNLAARVAALETAFRTSVVLTTDDCSALGQGWTPFLPAAGRFMLVSNEAGASDLAPRRAGEVGGRDAVTLERRHTPQHEHNVAADRHTHDVSSRPRNHTVQRAQPGGRQIALRVLEPGGSASTGLNTPGTERTKALPSPESFDILPPFYVANACVFEGQ